MSAEHAVEVTLRTYAPSGKSPERIATFSVAANGRGPALFVRHTPKILQGGSFLIDGDAAWALPPRSTDEPVEQNEGQIVLGEAAGPVVWRVDLSRGWEVKFLAAESFDGVPCRKYALARAGEGGLFRRVDYWITTAELLPKRIDYYGGEPERLLRSARYEGFAKGAFGSRPARIISEGGNPWEETVEITLTDYRKLKLKGLAIDRATMRRVRDLARLNGPPKTAPDFQLEEVLDEARKPAPAG